MHIDEASRRVKYFCSYLLHWAKTVVVEAIRSKKRRGRGVSEIDAWVANKIGGHLVELICGGVKAAKRQCE